MMAERLINATVNIERFLPEIPRFFGSFNAILTELMQNAYRAGATEVEAEINIGERLLTIQDNGIGVEDPQSLLSVGDTGWDEDRVIDPAGMGAFAALRPEFVKQVEYESHGKKSWRMIVKQDVLNGGAAVLKELHSNGKTGLSVTLHFADDYLPDNLYYSMEQARAFYPFRFRFIDEDGCDLEIHPKKNWEPEITLDLEVGKFEWRSNRYYEAPINKRNTVWEYRTLESDTVARALKKAARDHEYSKLANEVFDDPCTYRWYIDPSCEVRPKLPDRNEILDDQALEKACREIVNAMVDYILEQAKDITADWPDRFRANRNSEEPEIPENASWFRRSRIKEILLQLMGWKRVSYSDPEDTCFSYMDEGCGEYLIVDEYPIEIYDKNVPIVASEYINMSLNTIGKSVSQAKDGKDPDLRIKGFRGNAELSPYIALADEISINGFGNMPYLLINEKLDDVPWLNKNERDHFKDQVILYAGTANEFIRDLHKSWRFVNFAGQMACVSDREEINDEWCRWEDGEPFFDHYEAKKTLTLDVTSAYEPDFLRERIRYYKSRMMLEKITEIKLKLIKLEMRFIDYARHYGDRSGNEGDSAIYLIVPFIKISKWMIKVCNKFLRMWVNRVGRKAGLLDLIR